MSSDYKIKIEEPNMVEIRRQADALGITVNTLMAKLVEERATITPSIDVAAGVFLSHLEPEHRKLILDCAAETHRSPAAYIMSYIHRARDQGATALPIPEERDPSVQLPLAFANDATADASTTLCEWCQRPLTTPYAGQRYCAPPLEGESCGRQASLAEVRAGRVKKREAGVPAPHIIDYTVRM